MRDSGSPKSEPGLGGLAQRSGRGTAQPAAEGKVAVDEAIIVADTVHTDTCIRTAGPSGSSSAAPSDPRRGEGFFDPPPH
jgi:hypothetical protein